MHFSSALLILVGGVAAFPLSTTVSVVPSTSASPSSTSATTSSIANTPTTAAQSSTPATVAQSSTPAVVASSTPASPSQPATFTAAQGAGIETDLTNFDAATKNLNAAIQAFVGGATIVDQGKAVTATGTAWQQAAATLLSDTRALNSKGGHFSTSDSSTLATEIVNNVGPDLITLYNTVISRKTIFTQVGELQHVHDTLLKMGLLIQQICDSLTPLFLSQDTPRLQTEGNKLTAAWQTVYAAYS